MSTSEKIMLIGDIDNILRNIDQLILDENVKADTISTLITMKDDITRRRL